MSSTTLLGVLFPLYAVTIAVCGIESAATALGVVGLFASLLAGIPAIRRYQAARAGMIPTLSQYREKRVV
jgi:hypothetical protein